MNAVEVLEAILDPHDATLDPFLRTYRYRKLGKGEEYAADWFRRKALSGPNNSWVGYSAFDRAPRTWMLRREDLGIPCGPTVHLGSFGFATLNTANDLGASYV